ncbi:MAG: leucine-rich repeat domain-containing protein [Lachnospiraceae bacterium]|nr:leucine-rich repeat domain-containing protein [Lachnospiraceae bacterium]
MKKAATEFLIISACIVLTGCHIKHEWKEATCTEPKTCGVCEKIQGEALGHKWQEATCTEPKTCSACGETEGEALGHKWQEATCTEPKICNVCGGTEGEPLGHKWKEATCQAPKTCNTCGETEGDVTEHAWQEATCADPKTCIICKETEGEPLGHDWQEATCTEAKTCNTCGEIDGEPLGHEAGDDDNCIRCGEYAKDGIAWSYEDYDGYGVLTFWGNGPLNVNTVEAAGFTHPLVDDLIRNTHEIIITGNIKGIGVIDDSGRIYANAHGFGFLKAFGKDEIAPLESIYIEDSVTGIIGAWAFYGGPSPKSAYANLDHVYIGNGIEEIGGNAFYQCQNLINVYIGENCKKIETGAFEAGYGMNVQLPRRCNYPDGTFYPEAKILEY